MSHEVELGRAVIALPSIDLELWLTTLITISSDTDNHAAQHQIVHLKNLEPIALLDYLSTGDVWVGRGTAMHMTFKFQKLEGPLDRHHLQQLGDDLMNAPAWKQLGHHLSLPLNYDPVDGDLRIDISQCRQNGTSANAEDDSLAISHAMDIKPSEETPVVRFESVDFMISISETQDRRVLRKRAKRELSKQIDDSGKVEDHSPESKKNSNHKRRPHSEFETMGFGRSNADHKASDQLYTKSGAQRSPTTPLNNMPLARGRRKRAFTTSEPPMIPMIDFQTSESAQLAGLTDVALRYSMCLGMKGSNLGPRIKASTFVYGLTDIAPALWRPGYVSALSQSRYTNPIISRSLSRISHSARSTGLKVKLRAVLESTTSSINKHDQCLAERSIVEKTISDRVWIHTRKSQLSKTPASLVQAFCVQTSVNVGTEESSEILEERNGSENTSPKHQDVVEPTSIRPADTQTRSVTTPTSSNQRLGTSDCVTPGNGDSIRQMQHATRDPGVCNFVIRDTYPSNSRETTGPVDAIEEFDCTQHARGTVSSSRVADHGGRTETLYGDTRVGNEGLLFDYEELDHQIRS